MCVPLFNLVEPFILTEFTLYVLHFMKWTVFLPLNKQLLTSYYVRLSIDTNWILAIHALTFRPNSRVVVTCSVFSLYMYDWKAIGEEIKLLAIPTHFGQFRNTSLKMRKREIYNNKRHIIFYIVISFIVLFHILLNIIYFN